MNALLLLLATALLFWLARPYIREAMMIWKRSEHVMLLYGVGRLEALRYIKKLDK